MGKKKPTKGDHNLHIPNKKALFDYELLEEYMAGLVLKGTEVKAIRMGKVNLKDSFCFFKNNELWVKGMHISHYQEGGIDNHDPTRPRKILLHKRELRKLQKAKEEKRLTIIPKNIFLNNKGLIKMRIALAKGKKAYDKRATIKDRDLAREQARNTLT